MKLLQPSYFQPRKPKDKLVVSKKFLALGKEEIKRGRTQGDFVRIREGAEKVFHALTEACAARIQKYGLPSPASHEDVRVGLESSHQRALKKTYENAFKHLHVGTYYRGWVDVQEIEQQVQEVEKAIKNIEKRIMR